MRTLFAIGVLAAVLAGCASTPLAKIKYGQVSEPVIPNHDVQLAKAVKQAQVSLPTFIYRMGNPKPQDQAFFVKTRVTATTGVEESIWVAATRFDENAFEGFVDTVPAGIDRKPGDEILVFRDKVIDWKIISNDLVEGAFTEEVWQMRSSVNYSPDLQTGFVVRY